MQLLLSYLRTYLETDDTMLLVQSPLKPLFNQVNYTKIACWVTSSIVGLHFFKRFDQLPFCYYPYTYVRFVVACLTSFGVIGFKKVNTQQPFKVYRSLIMSNASHFETVGQFYFDHHRTRTEFSRLRACGHNVVKIDLRVWSQPRSHSYT